MVWLWEMREKGKGGGEGGGWEGTGKGTGKSMRTRSSKLPLGKLPFSFSPNTVSLGVVLPHLPAVGKKAPAFLSFVTWLKLTKTD